MKYLYILLFISGLIVSVGCSMYWWVTANPMDTVNSMFAALKDNKITAATTFFGGNTCNCPKDYSSWMKYESGHEPNLAFLAGHPFGTSELDMHKVADDGLYVIPWQRPEKAEALVRLNFSDAYRPYYLPLPLAFGLSMPEKDWKNFLADPLKDKGLGLCLRLRPSLSAGLISNTPLTPAEQKLPPDVQRYLRPKDCAPVIGLDGKAIPPEQLVGNLPRLSSVEMKFTLVRRGQLEGWTISDISASHPEFSLKGS